MTEAYLSLNIECKHCSHSYTTKSKFLTEFFCSNILFSIVELDSFIKRSLIEYSKIRLQCRTRLKILHEMYKKLLRLKLYLPGQK